VDDGTGLRAYRAILALPGVGAVTAVSFLARLPASASAMTLTLHVVLTLDQGYAAAGVVGAAATVGMAVGAPLLGRLVDRRGLRTMLALTLSAQALFWGVAPFLPYPALLVCALLGGLLGVPVYSVTRQSLAVLVPPERRRPAFALDSMSVEISYIIGPATGALLLLLNPPTRLAHDADSGPPPPVRQWLDRRLIGALLATTAAVMVVFGTELSMIAGLQLDGHATWIPLVNAVWCVASLVGGFVYGAARRSRSLPLFVGGLGVTALPVALAGPWWSYALLLVPLGLLIAPSMAASSETVSALTPEHVRGLVTGLHGSAITIGAATATPLAGLLVDVASPAVAVLTVGSIGLAAAVLVGLLIRPRREGTVAPSAGSQPI
jgi:MFS family permease